MLEHLLLNMSVGLGPGTSGRRSSRCGWSAIRALTPTCTAGTSGTWRLSRRIPGACHRRRRVRWEATRASWTRHRPDTFRRSADRRQSVPIKPGETAGGLSWWRWCMIDRNGRWNDRRPVALLLTMTAVVVTGLSWSDPDRDSDRRQHSGRGQYWAMAGTRMSNCLVRYHKLVHLMYCQTQVHLVFSVQFGMDFHTNAF